MPFQQGYGGSFELATMIAQKTPEDLNRIFIQFVIHRGRETQLKLQAYFRSIGQNNRFKL